MPSACVPNTILGQKQRMICFKRNWGLTWEDFLEEAPCKTKLRMSLEHSGQQRGMEWHRGWESPASYTLIILSYHMTSGFRILSDLHSLKGYSHILPEAGWIVLTLSESNLVKWIKNHTMTIPNHTYVNLSGWNNTLNKRLHAQR